MSASYLWQMSKFFGSHIKSVCVLVVVLGLAMLHLPDFTNQNDFESFKSWVHTQISNDFSKNVTDTAPSSRFDLSPDFIKHIKKVLDEKPRENEEPVDAITLQYLYLTWSQFYSAADMAGTFSNERIKPARFLNIFPHTPGIPAASVQKDVDYVSGDVSNTSEPEIHPSRFLTEPAVSGMSIHAP